MAVCTFVGSVGACFDIGWTGVGVKCFSSSLRRINDLPWPSISGLWGFGSVREVAFFVRSRPRVLTIPMLSSPLFCSFFPSVLSLSVI